MATASPLVAILDFPIMPTLMASHVRVTARLTARISQAVAVTAKICSPLRPIATRLMHLEGPGLAKTLPLHCGRQSLA